MELSEAHKHRLGKPYRKVECLRGEVGRVMGVEWEEESDVKEPHDIPESKP